MRAISVIELSQVNGSQSLTHFDSGKHSPTSNIARAVTNECRGSEDSDLVDEVVAVEINSVIWPQFT